MQCTNDFSKLLLDAKNGDDNSFAKIKEMYMPLISSKVSSFSYTLEEDEILQLSYIALFDAVRTYDEENYADKVTFGLYADICISRRLYSASKKKRHSDIIYGQADVDVSPEVTFVEKEEFFDEISRIREVLTEFEFSAFRLYLKGLSYKEIGDKLGKSSKSIDNAMTRIRKKLRDLNDI